jgi:Mn2+/Fe2+ NRAMP family transporter
VVGSAYTSVSFLKTLHPWIVRRRQLVLVIFVLISLSVFLWFGQPVKILVYAGALNGFILPFALAMMLFAVYMQRGAFKVKHPLWLSVAGWLVVLATCWMGIRTILSIIG